MEYLYGGIQVVLTKERNVDGYDTKLYSKLFVETWE